MSTPSPVVVQRETVVLPTYEPHWPDRYPMFLEKRVYQGSSGRVYPLPFTDRIAETPKPCEWESITIENEFLRIMILPALGGRIHRAQDKTNGYDFIYYQPVIKPALVGLAGPWASGGIEFNWPQHHRPSTFMPADVAVEKHPDGSATVWLSEHDPMARMKGMHGVRLHPGKSYLEVVGRVYNRTQDVQTFLWWANVATRVHEQYQSFFPPDATHVADHAKRATSTFPRADDHYYGVDYGSRGKKGIPALEIPRLFVPPHVGASTANSEPGVAKAVSYSPDDLSWYANIPVPTSYMCMGSSGDFAGGYDYKAQAGLIQVSNHHISPGKKQWTWGNQEFGYAWDRNLTDADDRGEFGPYIELMAGVYTDNQPDFSFLQPGETKTWSQFWYPIRSIGAAQHATIDAAISLHLEKKIARVGVAVTSLQANVSVHLEQGGKIITSWTETLDPDRPFVREANVGRIPDPDTLSVRVLQPNGHELISFTLKPRRQAATPPPATEPPLPASVIGSDELFLIGLHLEQYRHATRMPQDYWREGLRRDSGDSRCHLALGRWHLRRGEFTDAERHLRASVARLVSRNPNPYDGESYYQLGVCLRHQAFAAALDPGKLEEAYGAFYKATWNHAWQAAGFHALAELDALRKNWPAALAHCERALRVNADNLRALNLRTICLQKLGRKSEADETLRATLALDPLDWWSRHLSGEKITCDQQVKLDLALDYVRAGEFQSALELLAALPQPKATSVTATAHLPDASLGAEPLVHYYRAWLSFLLRDPRSEARHLKTAAQSSPDFCFPARSEEITILQHAIAGAPHDGRALFYLGNLFYDRRRHREAISLWERAVKLEPANAVAWRNLGIGYFNILHRPAAARRAYDRAFSSRPHDARLLYERDQLWKRLRVKPALRLRELKRHSDLVRVRDDLSVEFCALCTQTGVPEDALFTITHRKFQPWEGGEGQALGQHVRVHLVLGKRALRAKDFAEAIEHFSAAMGSPENLGEARHLLSNQSDLHYWLGCALAAVGEHPKARLQWKMAADFKGDFQSMSVRSFSELTYYSALACSRIGQKSKSQRLLRALSAYADALRTTPSQIDYFATSLPTMLLFEEDLQERQKTTALFLTAQARLGLGRRTSAIAQLQAVLLRDPNHALAADLYHDVVTPSEARVSKAEIHLSGGQSFRLKEVILVDD